MGMLQGEVPLIEVGIHGDLQPDTARKHLQGD